MNLQARVIPSRLRRRGTSQLAWSRHAFVPEDEAWANLNGLRAGRLQCSLILQKRNHRRRFKLLAAMEKLQLDEELRLDQVATDFAN